MPTMNRTISMLWCVWIAALSSCAKISDPPVQLSHIAPADIIDRYEINRANGQRMLIITATLHAPLYATIDTYAHTAITLARAAYAESRTITACEVAIYPAAYLATDGHGGYYAQATFNARSDPYWTITTATTMATSHAITGASYWGMRHEMSPTLRADFTTDAGLFDEAAYCAHMANTNNFPQDDIHPLMMEYENYLDL